MSPPFTFATRAKSRPVASPDFTAWHFPNIVEN